MMRKLIGVTLFVLGVVGLLIDYDGIRTSQREQLHALNAAIELGLMFAGIVALIPTLAMEIARSLPLFGKAVTATWPGGMRRTDPDPQPDVPPPPSVQS